LFADVCFMFSNHPLKWSEKDGFSRYLGIKVQGSSPCWGAKIINRLCEISYKRFSFGASFGPVSEEN